MPVGFAPTGTLGTTVDTITYTYGDTNWGDLLTAYDGTAITYDGIGNPLSGGTWSYAWRNGRELASMTSGSNTNSYILAKCRWASRPPAYFLNFSFLYVSNPVGKYSLSLGANIDCKPS